MRTSIAIYFDLENVDKRLNLQKLLESITLNIDDSTPVFAIKLACGDHDIIVLKPELDAYVKKWCEKDVPTKSTLD